MRFETLLNQWQAHLKELMSTLPAGRLKDAMSYSLEGEGKRLRPMLLLSVASVHSKETVQKSLQAATALEFIHTYSLIHDDLPAMDNDDYRRGKLTNHKKFDEATAILAGDALLTDAFGLIAQDSHLSPIQKIECIGTLVKAAGSLGMIQGQMIDMKSTASGEMTLDQLRQMHYLKTGKLFIAAVETACIIADFDQLITQSLTKFATHFGVAFQIHNDLLDSLKHQGTQSDEVNDKGTYVTLLGEKESIQQLEKERQQAATILTNLTLSTAYDFSLLSEFLNFLNYPMTKVKEESHE